MNRPHKYHIDDAVLMWVYGATDAEEYFDYLEAEVEQLNKELNRPWESMCEERCKALEAENQRLQERVKELESWVKATNPWKDTTSNSALQHKEGE